MGKLTNRTVWISCSLSHFTHSIHQHARQTTALVNTPMRFILLWFYIPQLNISFFFLLFYVYSTDTLLMLKVDRSIFVFNICPEWRLQYLCRKTVWAPVRVSSSVRSETMRLSVSCGGAAVLMSCYVAGSDSLFGLLVWAISGLSIFWHTVSLSPCLCASLLTQLSLFWLWIWLHMWQESI